MKVRLPAGVVVGNEVFPEALARPSPCLPLVCPFALRAAVIAWPAGCRVVAVLAGQTDAAATAGRQTRQNVSLSPQSLPLLSVSPSPLSLSPSLRGTRQRHGRRRQHGSGTCRPQPAALACQTSVRRCQSRGYCSGHVVSLTPLASRTLLLVIEGPLDGVSSLTSNKWR